MNDYDEYNEDKDEEHFVTQNEDGSKNFQKWSPEREIFAKEIKEYESPMDKQSNITFLEYLEQNQSQTVIQNLITKFKQSNNSNVNTKQSFKLNTKRLTSMREEVLDIVSSLNNKENILANVDQIYQQQDTENEQLLKSEIAPLTLPLDLMEITERCENLERLLKVVSFQLSFNVMKHSDEFVSGMTLIQGIQEDLVTIKDHSQSNKESLRYLQSQVVINSMKALMLERKKKRIMIAKTLTINLIQKQQDNLKQVKVELERNNFYQGLLICKSGINDIEKIKSENQFNFNCLDIFKEKFEERILLIREKMIQCFSQLCLKFNTQLYDKVIQGLQLNIFESKQLDLTQNKNISTTTTTTQPMQRQTEWLINLIKDKFRTQVETQMKIALLKYCQNNEQLQKLGINASNPQIKMGSLCNMLDQNYQIQAICEQYKILSNIMYNHHLITRHHLYKNNSAFDQNIQESLLQDRKPFWDFVQDKMEKYLQFTEDKLLMINGRELYDLLSLSNTFIEIGQEFAGQDNPSLINYLINNYTDKYAKDFKTKHINNLKNILEREEFDRLPLPDNFEIREITNPLSDFPANLSQNLSLFIKFNNLIKDDADKENEPFLTKKDSIKGSKNLFSQFAIFNPFEKLQLISLNELNQLNPQPNNAFSQFDTGSTQSFVSSQKFKDNNFQNEDDSDNDDDEEDMDVGDEEEVKVCNIKQNYINQSSLDGASRSSLISYQQNISIDLKKNLVISSSGLNMVKGLVTRYLEMMSVCRHMTFDLFLNLTQACEFYCFIIFHMFAQSQSFKRLFDDSLTDMAHQVKSKMNTGQINNGDDPSKYADLHELYIFQSRFKHLRNHMLRIKDFAEINFSEKVEEMQFDKEKFLQSIKFNYALFIVKKIIPKAQIFDLHNENRANDKELIYKSIIAVESVMFIHQSLQSIKSIIKPMLNSQQQSFMIQFYNNFDMVVDELRSFIYMNNVEQIVNLDQTIVNIQFINWSIKQKKNEISSYVDKIFTIHDENLKKQLQSISQQQGESQLPKYLFTLYTAYFIDYISIDLLDSISKIKKCNEVGRESLLEDVKALKKGFEKLTDKSTSSLDKVEQYIQAYFSNRDELLSFIKQNDLVFSYNQVKNLLNISPAVQQNIKNADKKEFLLNVEIFYRDYFNNFMLSGSTHQQ